jgi:hypothetical protein
MGNITSKNKNKNPKARNLGSKPSVPSTTPDRNSSTARQAPANSAKRFADLPPTYENSCALLSSLVHRRDNRHSLVKLRDHEAQVMVDFLQRVNIISGGHTFSAHKFNRSWTKAAFRNLQREGTFYILSLALQEKRRSFQNASSLQA